MLGVNFVPRAFSWLEGALVVSADCHWYGSCPSNCSHRSPSWCCGYWQRLSEGINCNILKHVKIALTLLQATSSSLCSPCPYGSPLGSSKVHVSCQGSPSRTVVPLKFPLITYPFSSTDKSFSPPRAILVAKNHVLEVYSLYPLGMCVRRHLSSSPDFSTPSTLTLYVYGHGSRTHYRERSRVPIGSQDSRVGRPLYGVSCFSCGSSGHPRLFSNPLLETFSFSLLACGCPSSS